MGIPHSPCKPGILHRRRELLLPTLNTEEIVIFLVNKEKEEKPPKVPVSHQSLSLSFLFDKVFVI
jgi:hypothetical protein